jgi:hypothetical protein
MENLIGTEVTLSNGIKYGVKDVYQTTLPNNPWWVELESITKLPKGWYPTKYKPAGPSHLYKSVEEFQTILASQTGKEN